MKGWRMFGKATLGIAATSLMLLVVGCGGNPDQNNNNGNTNTTTNSNGNTNTNSNGNTNTSSKALTYHKDARAILEAKCQNCHTPGNIGPFPITSFKEASQFKSAIRDSIQAHRMPPWKPDDSCNEYKDSIGMTEQERKILIDWIDQGAAEGDPTSYKKPEIPKAPEFRNDVEVKLPEPYVPKQKPDDYRCFIIDWPKKTDTYVTGYRVVADNKETAHHLIAFVIPPSLVDTFQKYDDAEEGTGYTCYGGPTGKGGGNNIGTFTKLRWVGAWAPGIDTRQFSEDGSVGIKIPAGSKIVVQMHYNVTSNDPKPDQSSIQFQVADKVEKEATIQPFADPSWVVGQTMPIPAGSVGTEHSFVTGLSSSRTVLLHGVGLHMHTRGLSASVVVERKETDDKVCAIRIKKWDFNWQNSYSLKEPIEVRPGDKVRLTCTWDNSAENQPMIGGTKAKPKDLNWGDGTHDEMCLGTLFLTYK
ncbi:MAG: hypothetical protein EP343_10565 [Deltaproteobacteria bacterium]|nr:MAG: hypothetical protein EP343_10565 [Deltaproteobacteria bacterium]